MSFEPDYQNIVDVVQNKRPDRLSLYEHIISPKIMEQILCTEFAKFEESSGADLEKFFPEFCRFFKEMTFDTVSYEWCVCSALPAKGQAILGRIPGPIQNRRDFEAVDWDGIVRQYISQADLRFELLGRNMPEGMKAIGGVGNGVFEISEDLVGLTNLAYMQVDDPELFAELFVRIGTSPTVIREHIIPQYRRVIDLIHQAGKPFLWHSCGCIFDVMDDVIDVGIDAKHSNEDTIAPYEKWIELYGDRIGLFGGIDVDLLCQSSPDEVFDIVVDRGSKYRQMAKGFALGSGNSIPDYVPVEGFLAMVRACQEIRRRENL